METPDEGVTYGSRYLLLCLCAWARPIPLCAVDSRASYRNHSGVPNLSRKRQQPALVALGKAIREVRQSKGITQGRLALIAELDRSYVGRVERGDNNAAVLTLSRLAAALDISVAKLMQKAGL